MLSKPSSRSLIDDAVTDYYDELCRAMRLRGHSSAVANEIVHDVYLRLTGKPRLPENTSIIKAFLIRACINLGIDRFRRERLESRLFAHIDEEALLVAQETADVDRLVDRHHRLELLRQAVMQMSLQRRRVFLASCLGNLTSEQIAGRVGISTNMVDRHLRKAYLHCLDRLEETL